MSFLLDVNMYKYANVLYNNKILTYTYMYLYLLISSKRYIFKFISYNLISE